MDPGDWFGENATAMARSQLLAHEHGKVILASQVIGEGHWNVKVLLV